jgi:serine/threonine protein kinase
VADFGTASNATSSRQYTTHLSRGTASYRAPEILDGAQPKFNNKTDIFALGSIFYEIVTGDKLFYDDFAIVNYSVTGNLPGGWWPETTPDSDTSHRLAGLERLLVVASMLEIDHHRRPSARDIKLKLDNIRSGISGFFDLLDSGTPIQVRLIVCLR